MPSIRIDGLTASLKSLKPKKGNTVTILDALTASEKVWGFDPFQRGKVLMTILVSCYQFSKDIHFSDMIGVWFELNQWDGRA